MESSLYNIINSSQAANTLLMVTAEDLRNLADRLVSETVRTIEQQHKPTYLTRKQLMELLQISNGTVYNYIRQGKLNPVYVGEDPRFDENEVYQALREGKLRRYHRNNS